VQNVSVIALSHTFKHFRITSGEQFHNKAFSINLSLYNNRFWNLVKKYFQFVVQIQQ